MNSIKYCVVKYQYEFLVRKNPAIVVRVPRYFSYCYSFRKWVYRDLMMNDMKKYAYFHESNPHVLKEEDKKKKVQTTNKK
jgi:hypothetical protein